MGGGGLSRLTLACLLALFCSSGAGANGPPSWRVTAVMADYRPADSDGSDAGLAVDRIGVELVRTLPRDGGLLSLAFEQEYATYGDDVGLFDGAGRAEVAALAVGAVYRWRTPAWRWFAGAKLLDSGVERVDLGDGLYAELTLGALRAFGERLALGLMITGRGGIEMDPEAGLVPLIEYRIDERNRIGRTGAAETTIGYSHRFESDAEFYLGLQFATRQFRLDDERAVRDAERGLRLGGIFPGKRGFTAEAYLGVVDRKLEFHADGTRLCRTDVERATYYGLAANYRF